MSMKSNFTTKTNRRHIPIAMAIILLLGFGASMTASGGDEVTYPGNYTHRPLLEFLTSLSCAPCMDYAHPAIHTVLENAEAQDGIPFNMVVFHQNIPGTDNLTTAESTERFQYYKDDISEGVPNMIFDGGFDEQNPSDADNIQNDIDASGERTVKKATLWTKFNVVGERLNFDVKVNNVDTNDIKGSLYVFVVENGVWAYSSHLDQHTSSNMVFRGYGLEKEEQSIGAGEWFNTSGSWDIFANASVPIVKENLTVVAALFDTEDHSTASFPNADFKNIIVPRCIQSATPETTEYDGGFPLSDDEPSSIVFSALTHSPLEPGKDDTITISVTIDSTYLLTSTTLSYQVDGGNEIISSMESSQSSYTKNIGPFEAGANVEYQVNAEDEMGFSSSSDKNSFDVKKEDELPDGTLKIESLRTEPAAPTVSTNIQVFATVTSDNTITSVSMFYWQEGSTATSKVMTKKDGDYYANIGRFAAGTKIFYNVTATDDDGNHASSSEYSVVVQDNTPTDGDDDGNDINTGSETPGFGMALVICAIMCITIMYLSRKQH